MKLQQIMFCPTITNVNVWRLLNSTGNVNETEYFGQMMLRLRLSAADVVGVTMQKSTYFLLLSMVVNL